ASATYSREREIAIWISEAAICGNPLWLASALRKLGQASQRIPMPEAESHPASAHLFIVNPLSGRNLAQLFATHPPLEERIRRLENAAYGRG
ncbi:protease HtpX, partial [Candidatus Endoriftia persephone str. Guaymas]|nr:protease HtpX [Candidatus Endoriftia persephone str. Guaymas]